MSKYIYSLNILGVAISMAKAGLSRNERHFLQDEGDVGDLDDDWRVWRSRVKNKIQPTITDTILILKHANNVDLKDYLLQHCTEDIGELYRLCRDLLGEKITEFCNAITPPTSE